MLGNRLTFKDFRTLNIFQITVRGYALKDKPMTFKKLKIREIKKTRKLEAANASLAAKGFLRPVKPYTPPGNEGFRIQELCSQVGIPAQPDTLIEAAAQRFTLFNLCFKEFKHAVPNSQLHTIETVGDLVAFYETPVDTRTPLDALKNMDLPRNLNIQHEYVRFHPDDDKMFNGKTAFPMSSTIVTGLKYKNKYKGYSAKTSWP